MRRQTTDQDKVFANGIGDKGLLSKIYTQKKSLLKLSNKKTLLFKNGLKTLVNIKPKKIYRWKMNI